MKKAVHKLNTKGFTLVELIVTLVLMGILLGIGGAALSAYVQFSKFRYQNETAQTLFTAAQTRLTQYRADGEALALNAVCTDMDSGVLTLNREGQMLYQLTDGDGEIVQASAVWQKKGTDGFGTLYSMTATAEDYTRYQNGDETLSASSRALYDILDAYLYDKSVLKSGTVCIELDPNEGTVYSVLYSQDAKGGFTYTGETGKTDIRDRTEAVRRSFMIGYYGAESLSRSVRTSGTMPSIRSLLLNNEDTLNLTWMLDKSSFSAASQLKYEIDIVDSETGNCVLKLTIDPESTSLLGNSTFVAEDSVSNGRMVDAAVSRAKTNVAGQTPEYVSLGTYTFPAYADNSETMHFVLDAVDAAATEGQYRLLASDAQAFSTAHSAYRMQTSFSLHRFLLESLGVDNIYCTVRTLESDAYIASAAKTSNTENMYFSAVDDKNGTRVCRIRCARHFNNIRYCTAEKSNADGIGVRYDVISDFSWNGNGGIVQAGAVFDTTAASVQINHASRDFEYLVSAGRNNDGSYGNVDFPSISQLRAGDILQTADNAGTCTVSGLSLSSETNLADAVPGILQNWAKTSDGAAATGLFLVNRGMIQNLALADVSVIGQDNAGAFCGINAGALQRLEVKSGSVYGKANVGGIFGCSIMTADTADAAQDAKLVLSRLVNRADVTGHTYVGGITGRLAAGRVMVYDNQQSVYYATGKYAIVSYAVEKCENYGVVRGDWKALTKNENGSIAALYSAYYSGSKQEEASYIGGILGYGISGYNEQLGKRQNTVSAECVLTDCISSPQSTAAELDALLTDISHDTESGGTGESVLRGIYVGGIIGCSDDAVLSGCTTKKSSRSEAFVIGGEYVGGIAGWSSGALENARILETQADVLGRKYVGGVVGMLAADNADDEPSIQGWRASGACAGTVGFAGGICGYSEGLVSGCTVHHVIEKTALKFADAAGNGADCVGGIIGWNSGEVENCVSSQVKSAGSNYIGGVAGFQTYQGGISGTSVEGGSVSGRDFVGGYVGLNLNNSVLNSVKGQTITPINVEGRYFVGGCFGACLIPADADTIHVEIQVENPLGTVFAQNAYAGGYAGICAVTAKRSADTISDDALFSALSSLDGNDLKTDCDKVETLLDGQATPTQLILSGNGAENTRLSGVYSGIYAGGVVGYIPQGTHTVMQDLTNGTPVTTTKSVFSAELGSGDNNQYSYAGGIIGRCASSVSIAACKNSANASVRVPAECLLGTLTEVNCGRIVACAAATTGHNDAAGVGGLVGLNLGCSTLENTFIYDSTEYDKAGIYRCSAAGITVSGKNQVGGIAAQNYGVIWDTELKNVTIVSGGTFSGGIAGRNDAQENHVGSISFCDATVISKIAVRGGLSAGIIAGITENGAGIFCDNGSILTIDDSCSVSASEKAGGAVGTVGEDSSLSNIHSYAAVLSSGEAGGIAGAVNGAELLQCVNYGDIDGQGTSCSVGGIAGVSSGRIWYCTDFGIVSAAGGALGGIVGKNTGDVQTCQLGSKENKLTLIGDKACGGIAGENSGTVSNCGVYGVTLKNRESTAEKCSIGGIVGSNSADGIVQGSGTAAYFAAPEALNASSELLSDPADGSVTIIEMNVGGNVGGIAGTNAGMLVGTEDYRIRMTSYVSIAYGETDNADYYGNLGGIAGKNTGTIQLCSFSGTISGTSGNAAAVPAYGKDAALGADGKTIYGIGGIAGVNGVCGTDTENAEIRDCYVENAVISSIGTAENPANTGGIAGVNATHGTISGIDFGSGDEQSMIVSVDKYYAYGETALAKANVKRTGSVRIDNTKFGNTGGVAGLNDGVITDICRTSADGEEPEKDQRVSPGAKILVTSYKGHCGGIVGFNFNKGSVTSAETGSGSFVWTKDNNTDIAGGGIIGYNISGCDVKYCYNWASVIKRMGNSVGGIIGRCEISSGAGTQIIECANYGDISGAERVGGIIGSLKYLSASIESCSNFGRVAGGSISGGILGMRYNSESTSLLSISNCENHNTIGLTNGSTSIGGICGSLGGSQYKSSYVFVSNCVNTGLILGSAGNSGGIAGACESNKGSYTIEYCVNYGYEAKGSNTVCGITPIQNKIVSVKHCVSVAGMKYPISSAASNTAFSDCFFFTDGGGQGERLSLNGSEWTGENGTVFRDLSQNPTELDAAEGYGDDIGLSVTGKSDNARYAMFKAIQPQLIEQLGEDTSAQIEKIEFRDDGGSLNIHWNVTEDSALPAYYSVRVQYSDGTDTEYLKYTDNMQISSLEHEGQMLTVTVRSGKIGEPLTAEHQIGYNMPSPQVHLEMTDVNGEVAYNIILDNAEELQNFLLAHPDMQGNALSLSDVTVQMTSAPYGFFRRNGKNVSGEFSSSESEDDSLLYYPANTNGRYISAEFVILQEKDAQAYFLNQKSIQMMRESSAIVTANLQEGTAALVPMSLKPKSGSVGFMSDGTNLYYEYLMNTKGQVTFMRTELLAEDSALGVDVCVSNACASGFANTSISMRLPTLPENLLTEYGPMYIRSYPASMSNQILLTGHSVNLRPLGEGITSLTAEQLTSLRVTDSGKISADQTETGADGLLIYLHANDADAGPVDEASESCVYQGGLRAGYVIEQTSAGGYTLYYDTLLTQGIDYTQAVDNSMLSRQVQYYCIGSIRDFQTAPQVSVKQEGTQITVSWTGEKNEAHNYLCSVYGIHIDEENEDDTTTVSLTLPSTPAYDSVSGRYTITFPDISGWNYQQIQARVTHLALTDKNGSVLKYACTGTAEIAVRQRLSQPVLSAATQTSDADDLIYALGWNAYTQTSDLKALDHYLIRINSKEMPEKLISTTDAEITSNPTATTIRLNLDEYAGREISITVQAAAKPQSTGYSDSLLSNTYTTTVASRLALPERVLSMQLMLDGEVLPADTVVSQAKYSALSCTLTADGSYAVSGHYEVVLGLSGAEGTVPDETELLNDGNAVYLDSLDLSSCTPSFLDSNCAGKYVYAKIRACASGYVCSGYAEYWFALPKAKLNTPTVTEGTLVSSDIRISSGGTVQDICLTAVQRTLRLPENAGGKYEILIQKQDGTELSVTITYNAAANTWTVYQGNGEAQNEVPCTNGTWALDDSISQSAVWNGLKLTCSTAAWVRLEQNAPVLVLPDCISANTVSAGTTITFMPDGQTKQVSVSALSTDQGSLENSDCYIWKQS